MSSLTKGLLLRSNDSDVRERRAAASGLGKVHSRVPAREYPLVIGRLIELMRDDDPGVRRRAAHSLAKLKDFVPEERLGLVIDGLFRMFNDPDPYVRCRTVSAIGHLAERLPEDRLPATADGFKLLLEERCPWVPHEVRMNIPKLMHRFSEEQLAVITDALLQKTFEANGNVVALGVYSLQGMSECIPEDRVVLVVRRLLDLARDSRPLGSLTSLPALNTLVGRLPQDQRKPVVEVVLKKTVSDAHRGGKHVEGSGLWELLDLIPKTHMRKVVGTMLKLSKSRGLYPRWIGADYLGRLAGHIEGRELSLVVRRLSKMTEDRDKKVRIQARKSLERFGAA